MTELFLNPVTNGPTSSDLRPDTEATLGSMYNPQCIGPCRTHTVHPSSPIHDMVRTSLQSVSKIQVRWCRPIASNFICGKKSSHLRVTGAGM